MILLAGVLVAGCQTSVIKPINIRCPGWTPKAYFEFGELLEMQNNGQLDIRNLELHIAETERTCRALDKAVCGEDCSSYIKE